MKDTRNYLAVDLGAESGRTIVGSLDGDKLTLAEIHRFPNGPVQLNDGLHWDALRLWSEIKSGIAMTVKSGVKLDGIGLDTWGVDFALLDPDHSLLFNPFHYRDATKRLVVTGPVAATAIGNVLIQAIALKDLGSLADARTVVRASFEVEEYHPVHSGGDWDEAYSKLLSLMERV
jgi:sugar (pentulose or hexulose) kinase